MNIRFFFFLSLLFLDFILFGQSPREYIRVDSSSNKINRTNNVANLNNFIKLGLHRSEAFINGFAVDNSVKKIGYHLQLEYIRKISSILGLGVRLGLSESEDINNPKLVDPDYEKIIYSHLILVFKFINSDKIQFHISGGTGFTRTKRILGGFSQEPNKPTKRIAEISVIDGLDGISINMTLSHSIFDNLVVGLDAGVISHNDGVVYYGLSFGKKF